MLARERMTAKVVAVGSRESVQRARELMQRHGIHHLPVLRGRTLVGIVSDRDLHGSAHAIADVMSTPALTISPDTSVDEAASRMQGERINALLVVDGKRLLGILTTSDVLKAFVDLSGVAEATTRMIAVGKGVRNAEQKLRSVLHQAHAEVKWMERRGQRFHLRIKTNDADEIVSALEGAGFDVSTVIMAPRPA